MTLQKQQNILKSINGLKFELGLGYKLFNSYGIVFDPQAKATYSEIKTTKKSEWWDESDVNVKVEDYDYSYLQDGYVFDKKLTQPLTFELPVVKELRTIFNGSETDQEKYLKVAIEYLCYFFNDLDQKTIQSPFSHFEEVKNKVKLIKVLNQEEFQDFISDLLSKDKALTQDLLEEIYAYSLSETANLLGSDVISFDVSSIKNKEMKLYFIEKAVLNKKDVNGYELVRFINFLLTDDSLYIHKTEKDYFDNKNKLQTVSSIIDNNKDVFKNIFTDQKYVDALSKVYKNHMKTFIWLRNLFNRALTLRQEQLKEDEGFKNKIKIDGFTINNQDDFTILLKLMIKSINKMNRLTKKGKIKQQDFSVEYNVNILTKSLEKQEEIFAKKGFTLKELLKLYYLVAKNLNTKSKDSDLEINAVFEKSFEVGSSKNERMGDFVRMDVEKAKASKVYPSLENLDFKSYKIRNGKRWVKLIEPNLQKEFKTEVLLKYLKNALENEAKIQAEKNANKLLKKFLKEVKDSALNSGMFKTEKEYNQYVKEVDEKPSKYLTTEQKVILDKVKSFEKIVLPLEFKSPLLFSDKNKLGNVYFGSQIKIQNGDRIGITWTQDIDYDLSYYDYETDCFYSWNRDYGSEEKGITHSGDCRSAGSEHLTFHKKVNSLDGLLQVNTYSEREDQGKNIQIFVKRKGEFIFLSEKFSFDGGNNNTIGYLKNGYFVLDLSSNGSNHISSATNYKLLNLPKTNVYKDNYKVAVDINKAFKASVNGLSLEELLDQLNVDYFKKSIFFKDEKSNEENQAQKACLAQDFLKYIEFTSFE